MTDTTANTGTVDAVAASLIEAPVKADKKRADPVAEAPVIETPDEDLGQSDEGHADNQNEVDDPEQLEAQDEGDGDEGDGDEGSDEDDTDLGDDEAEQLYTVKVDGRDQQVTLSELRRGYSGQAFIQKGMEEVKTFKKEAESVYTALQSERQQLSQFVQAVQQGQVPLTPPQRPDDSMRQNDPIGYMEARIDYDDAMARYGQAQAAMQELNSRSEAAEDRARQAHLAQQHSLVARAIPEFADPNKVKAHKAMLISVAQDAYHYSPEELQGITDARVLMVLNDAAKYRQLMSGKRPKPVAEKQVDRSVPVVRSGARVAPNQGAKGKAEKAKAQMKRTGSVEDTAKFLLM